MNIADVLRRLVYDAIAYYKASGQFILNDFDLRDTQYPSENIDKIPDAGIVYVIGMAVEDVLISRGHAFERVIPIQVAIHKVLPGPPKDYLDVIELYKALDDQLREAAQNVAKYDTRFAWLRSVALKDENETPFTYVLLREGNTLELYFTAYYKIVAQNDLPPLPEGFQTATTTSTTSTTTTSPTTTTTTTQEPVATLTSLWTMDEYSEGSASIPRADVISGHDAQDPTQAASIAGRCNLATWLGPNQYLEVPHHDDFSPASSFTVGCWIRLHALNRDDDFIVKGLDSDGNRSWRLGYKAAGQHFEFAVSVDGTDEIVCRASKVATAGQWHLVIGEYNSVLQTLRIAHDAGGPLDPVACLGPPLPNTLPLLIGEDNVGGEDIDETYYLPRLMTVAEYNWLWNNGLGQPWPWVGVPLPTTSTTTTSTTVTTTTTGIG